MINGLSFCNVVILIAISGQQKHKRKEEDTGWRTLIIPCSEAFPDNTVVMLMIMMTYGWWLSKCLARTV